MRSLYIFLLRLHPPAFKYRFGDEMLAGFDEAPARDRPALLSDALLSLARQWLLRPHVSPPSPDLIPAVFVWQQFAAAHSGLSVSRWLQGCLATISLFALAGWMMTHGGTRAPHRAVSIDLPLQQTLSNPHPATPSMPEEPLWTRISSLAAALIPRSLDAPAPPPPPPLPQDVPVAVAVHIEELAPCPLTPVPAQRRGTGTTEFIEPSSQSLSRATPVPLAVLSPCLLASYAGTYEFGPPQPFRLTVTYEGGQLFAELPGHHLVALRPVTVTRFHPQNDSTRWLEFGSRPARVILFQDGRELRGSAVLQSPAR